MRVHIDVLRSMLFYVSGELTQRHVVKVTEATWLFQSS